MQGLLPSQSHTQAQHLTLGLQQTQALASSLSLTRTYGPEDPENNFRAVLAEVIKQIKNPDLRTALTAFIEGNPELVPALLSGRKELAIATKKSLDKFAVSYVFRASTDSEGKFIHMLDENGRVPLNPLATKMPQFMEAYFDPEGFEQKTVAYQKTLRAAAKNVNFIAEFTEMMDAIRVVATIRPQLDAFCRALNLLFVGKDEKGQLVLQGFLRNLFILENLDLVLSERLLKRFVHRFYKIGERARARDHEERILNTIAEFTLLSMGIISPDIFELRRIPRNTEQFSNASAFLKEVNVDLNKLIDNYSMSGKASFTWFNRYATRRVRNTATTEATIRTFITETVRKDRTRVLEIVEFPSLFEKLKALKANSEDRNEFADASTSQLAEVLTAPHFQEAFGQLLHGWYPKLESLL